MFLLQFLKKPFRREATFAQGGCALEDAASLQPVPAEGYLNSVEFWISDAEISI
jgi:hypothetical protein